MNAVIELEAVAAEVAVCTDCKLHELNHSVHGLSPRARLEIPSSVIKTASSLLSR